MDKVEDQNQGTGNIEEQLEFSSFLKVDQVNMATPELKKMLLKGQLFYDNYQKGFLFREKENVVFTQGGDQKKLIQFKIPYDKKIFAMSLHKSAKYIAYSIADNTLVIVNLADGQREQRIKMSSSDSTQKILHFSWVYQNPSERNIDFILCEKSGVRLYKIADDKCILKEQKYYEMNCSAAWYEPINQVLLTTSLKENGKLHTFFFGEKKSQLKYRGPEFYLEDNKKEKKSIDVFLTLIQTMSELDQHESNSNNASNTQTSQGFDSLVTKSFKTQYYFDELSSQLFLMNIYSKTYLIFVNQMDGKVVIYHLLYEKILCLDWKISIPSDSLISICVVEDLLLVNSHQNSISMVYDIKRQIPTTPLGPPQPIFIKYFTKQLYDKPVICLQDEWIIDIENVDIYKFKVKLEMIQNMIEGDVECFNIILRRDNPKSEAIDFIKKRIKEQKEINHISIYFKHIFEIYKEAQKDTNSIDTSSTTCIQDTIKAANKTKIKQGYTIIFPSDLHQELLVPIVQDKSIPRQYIIDILSEYLRLAYNNGIIQLLKTQELLIDVVLKQQNFNTLHFLIQYKILSDSSELAKKLINMSCPHRIKKLDLPQKGLLYKPGFQLGIDMLFRQKKFNEMIETFFQFGMFLEALDLIQRHHIYKIKAKEIASLACQYEGNCSKNDVFKFYEYLLQSSTYLNYQSQNSNNSLNQLNKIPFTLSQLKDEFKRAKERLVLSKSNSGKSKSKQVGSTEEIISPIKQQGGLRRNQTSASKTEDFDQLKEFQDSTSFKKSHTVKEEEQNIQNEESTAQTFQSDFILQSSIQSNVFGTDNDLLKNNLTNTFQDEKENIINEDTEQQLTMQKKESNSFIEEEQLRDDIKSGQIIEKQNEEDLI